MIIRIEDIYKGRIYTFEQLSRVYVNGNMDAAPAPDWVRNVTIFYNQISGDLDGYFMIEPQPIVLVYKKQYNEES